MKTKIIKEPTYEDRKAVWKELEQKRDNRWQAAADFEKGIINAEQYVEIANKNSINISGFIDYVVREEIKFEEQQRKAAHKGFIRKVTTAILSFGKKENK